MSATQYATDALTRHQVFLQRYATKEVKDMLPLLREMLKNINTRILTDDVNILRLTAIQRDLTMIISASMQKLNKNLTDDLIEFSAYESTFTQKLLSNMATLSVAGVNVDQVAGILTKTPMILINDIGTTKLTIDQAVRQFSGTTSTTVNRTLQAGLAEGKTTKEIANEITKIVKNRTTAQAEALIRTAANHAGATARKSVYDENSDILDGEKFTAVLDSRTSLSCAGNDGKIFPVGEGVEPPLHFNCRSIRIPVVKPEYTVKGLKGERASRGESGKTEYVGANVTYGGWLRKQPTSFQDKALGKERAKLFRNGGLTIDKFTNNKNIAYSLDELRELEPEAFKKANI